MLVLVGAFTGRLVLLMVLLVCCVLVLAGVLFFLCFMLLDGLMLCWLGLVVLA